MRFSASVVSYRNSTSNHNSATKSIIWSLVVSYRNSTSNHNLRIGRSRSSVLYLIEILHQTTTASIGRYLFRRCILSKFYIKPQLSPQYMSRDRVVSYRNSTSNHNRIGELCALKWLYLIEILHQTTTICALQIFSFGCILSKFYIKPQLMVIAGVSFDVVSYRNSTSNHNYPRNICLGIGVVSYRNSTSNHNTEQRSSFTGFVVSYRNSTSNHNTLCYLRA